MELSSCSWYTKHPDGISYGDLFVGKNCELIKFIRFFQITKKKNYLGDFGDFPPFSWIFFRLIFGRGFQSTQGVRQLF